MSCSMTIEKHEYTQQPLNQEPPTKTLIDHFLTPQEISYDRNHGPIPPPSNEKHIIGIGGVGLNSLQLTVDQLRSEFNQHTVTCALQCAGNRRHTMRTLLKEVQGIDWGDAAVMNCKWRGPLLRDVLLRAGLHIDPSCTDRQLHVAFSCYKVECQDDEFFEASVPLMKCLEEGRDAILALEVNDTPLTANHGYPVRVVLPGIVGVRWVKWLEQITVQDHESPNVYQQRDYKILPPDATDSEAAEKYWGSTPPMYDVPINSVVAVPGDGETVTVPPNGFVEVKGYALPDGADGPVTRVQVSGDGGKSWVEAQLDGSSSSSKWCWVLWRANVRMRPGTKAEVLSRATDLGGNSQKEHSQWNLRGVGYSGYGRATDLTIV